jgi:hypothetical protein
MEKYEVNFSIYTIFYKSCLGERWDLVLKERRLPNLTAVTQLERKPTCQNCKSVILSVLFNIMFIIGKMNFPIFNAHL